MPRNYQFGMSVQQAVHPRVSVEVGYNQRWFPAFTVTDNRAVTAADYDPYQHHRAVGSAAARRRRVRDQRICRTSQPACVRQDGRIRHAVARTSATRPITGTAWTSTSTRGSADGLTLQGGTSTGRRVADACEIATVLPEAPLFTVAPEARSWRWYRPRLPFPCHAATSRCRSRPTSEDWRRTPFPRSTSR